MLKIKHSTHDTPHPLPPHSTYMHPVLDFSYESTEQSPIWQLTGPVTAEVFPQEKLRSSTRFLRRLQELLNCSKRYRPMPEGKNAANAPNIHLGPLGTYDPNAFVLPVFPNNVRSQQLQQLPVLLNHIQLVRVFGGRRSHAGEPGLEAHWLHTSQLCQRATEMQEARVRALLS